MTGRFQIGPTLFREATQQDEGALTLIAEQTIATYVVENLDRHYCPILLTEQLPVGFAICRDNTIDLIVVDYRYHRSGFGTQLLVHCETEMFGAYPAIALHCFEHNEQANRFFRKNGWIETLRYRNKHSGVRTILYQKQRSDTKK